MRTQNVHLLVDQLYHTPIVCTLYNHNPGGRSFNTKCLASLLIEKSLLCCYKIVVQIKYLSSCMGLFLESAEKHSTTMVSFPYNRLWMTIKS